MEALNAAELAAVLLDSVAEEEVKLVVFACTDKGAALRMERRGAYTHTHTHYQHRAQPVRELYARGLACPPGVSPQ